MINHGQKISQRLREFAQTFEELGSIATEIEQFRKDASSWRSGFEAFLKGFMGDPRGKYNEMQQGASALEQKRQAWLQRWNQVQSDCEQLTNEENQLRATLSQRYGREFPQI